ncbi:hypothetical protein [Tsukamurella hominis]|uniref:hypothetical protein n=1 Tax=Tsukamurella hominis TaxID=1970232 RepID=UPI0039E9CE3B
MIDRPDTPHADVLLEGIWEDEVTPDDLASRALSAAQASSYAFRVASEGTTATAQLAEVDVSEFLESETGKWAQSFIGIVRVGESLVHVSHALGELARSLQQVNLEQSEIVYQVEAEIEAAQLQSAQAGVDPADRIAELIAGARARAAEVAEKMVTPETASSTKKPAVGLVSGFMAFGRVPGASAEAAERNGRVARNGHARNGYAIRNSRADQNGHAVANGRDVANGHEEAANGDDVVNGGAAAERVVSAEKPAAAAAHDAFANSGDEATTDSGFLAFGRTPAPAVPHADEASDADEIAVDDVVAEASGEADAPPAAAADAPVISNGFLGLGSAPFVGVPSDDAAVPVVPQPLAGGFLTLGRTPSAGAAAVPGPSSGPIPVVAPTQFLPLPATPAEIVAGASGDALGAEFGAALPLAGAVGGLRPESEDSRADANDDGFLSFGRVPGTEWGGSGALPTVPAPEAAAVTPGAHRPADDELVARVEDSAEAEPTEVVEELSGEADDAIDGVDADAAARLDDDAGEPATTSDVEDTDDLAELDGADDLIDVDETEVDETPAPGDETPDDDVDFADELDAEADELLAPEEQDDHAIADADADADVVLDDLADEVPDDVPVADEVPAADDAEAATGGPAADDLADVVSEDADVTGETAREEPADDTAEADDDSAEADEDTAEADDEAPVEGFAVQDDAAHDEPADDGETAAPDEAVQAVEVAEATAEPVRTRPAPAPKPVRKSGPVKFSDLLKAANAKKVDPAHLAPAAIVAAVESSAVAREAEPTAAADETAAAASETAAPVERGPSPEEQVEEQKAPVKPAPVLATGPAILGRTEPLVLRKKVSPVVQQVHDAVASILGSLRGGPHGPDSGLHWAAGLLVKDAETIMAVTTSDAGWLPPGVVIPAGVRVLWNVPRGYRWASIDDPVRQLIAYAEQDGYTLTAVATTHQSRAYAPVIGEENIVGVHRPGAVLPGGRSRFEATVSPARLQHIRSLDRDQAERQARALIRDLETQPIAPEHAIGIEAARIDARCFLDERDEVPPPVLEQLHADERALGDALVLDRTPASAADLTASAPEAARLRDRMLERAILVATLAAAHHDIESAVYAWTYARFLSSQDQDSEQER